MSLINEALRKARQAASEHDSKQAEDPFRPARAYPSRRSGSPNSLLIVALTAVAAGAIVASALWWFFGSRQTAQQPVVASHQGRVVAAVVTETSTPLAEVEGNQAISGSVQMDVVVTPAPQPVPDAETSTTTAGRLSGMWRRASPTPDTRTDDATSANARATTRWSPRQPQPKSPIRRSVASGSH